jgi:hypothetical protein
MQQGAVLVQEMAQRWSTSSMTRRWTRDRAASAVVILISYHFSRAESVFCWYKVFFSLFKNKIEKQRMSSSELSFYQPDNQPQTHGKNFNYMTDIYVHCIQTDLRKNKQNKWIHYDWKKYILMLDGKLLGQVTLSSEVLLQIQLLCKTCSK